MVAADHNGVVDIVADNCIADYCTVVVVVVVDIVAAAGSFFGLPKEQEERADSVVVVEAVAIQPVVEAYHNTVAVCRGELKPLVEVVTDGKPTAVEQQQEVLVDSVAGEAEDYLSPFLVLQQ